MRRALPNDVNCSVVHESERWKYGRLKYRVLDVGMIAPVCKWLRRARTGLR